MYMVSAAAVDAWMHSYIYTFMQLHTEKELHQQKASSAAGINYYTLHS